MYDKLYQYSQKLSLLIVEDYKPLRDNLVDILNNFFDTVTYALDGKDGLRKYNNYYQKHDCGFDIIISDIQMPNMDGITMSKEIRKIDKDQTIIILSAHTDTNYLVSFINIGISKFITKPIDTVDLFKTLYEITKRKVMLESSKRKNIVYLDSNCLWNIEKQELTKDKEIIELTINEKIILEFLIQKKESICSSSDINYILHLHDININEESIRNYIFGLRKKISPKIITSIYGIGYRLLTFRD